MPRLPIDYTNTIIYKIVCRDLEIKNCYVGHTTDFSNRKRRHKCNCKNEIQYVYQFIREHGGWVNWDMIMIEQYPCNNLYEASARERYWIETLSSDLNQLSPPTGLPRNEYKKQYCTKNKDKILENKKQYYNDNRDKIAEYKKQYHIENRNKRLEKQKQYYVENKDKIFERNKQRVCCIQCKTELSFAALARHYRLKH